MKKNDLRLIGIILLLAVLMLAYQYTRKESSDGTIVITVDGHQYGTFILTEEQIIDINHTNTLEITEGKARMTDAVCPDKLCMHQKAIARDGESIICLPNKVVVTIEGGQKRALDAVTN